MKERFFTMFFKKITFLMFFACFAGFSYTAFGACYNSGAGEYCLTYKKYSCPSGCWCEAVGGDYGALDRKGNGKKDISQGQVANWCAGSGTCPWNAGGNQCGTSDAAKVFKCPSSYPSSEGGSSKSSDCYNKTSCSKTLRYQKIKVPAGYYLPTCSDSAVKCDDSSECAKKGEYCPGAASYGQPDGWYPRLQNEVYVGCKQCPEGKVPNKDRTACEDKGPDTYTCIAGEYLPANSESCAACPAGKLCLGGTWEKRAVAQGDDDVCDDDSQIINSKGSACIPCPKGKKANETYTECVEGDPIKVNPGEYLPANSVTPKKCNNARRFCPGGYFRMLAVDQGQYECPNGGTVSADKKSCILTLDKKQMRCGPNGTRQDTEQCVSETPCWIKTDPEDFINCIYGVRFDVNEVIGNEE